MSMSLWLWVMLGFLVGVGHAGALWQTAHRRASSYAAAVRMPVLVAIFVAAALAGRVLPVLGGWVGGLTGAGGWLIVRSAR